MQLALLEGPAPRIQPRDYQVSAVDACRQLWDTNPALALLIVAPTGSGKTIMIGMAAEEHTKGGSRVLVMSHVPELIEQGYATFRRMCPGMPAGIYAAKLGRKDKRAKVTFALVQSVARNVEAFRDVGLIIVDECHMIPHSSDGQYRAVIDAVREARGGKEYVKILGLTATPWRLNSGNLLEPYKDSEPLFDAIAYDIDMLDMVEQGHLCRIISKGSKTKMDTQGIHKRMGEFKEDELNQRFNTEVINNKIADEIVKVGTENNRRSWLVFAINVDHAQRLAQLIRDRGVSCQAVWGEMPTADRRRIIADYKAYRIRCLTSVNVLSTGFDHPGVDLGAMCRPTASPGLYLQQAGRLLRVTPGKGDAILLDFACNVFRHGLLTNVKGVFKNKKEEEEILGPKGRECPECALINEPGATVCSGCGYQWPPPVRRNTEEKLSTFNVAERVMDEVVWADVIDATYRHNAPKDKPATLQLLYRVQLDGGYVQATEVFCFNHDPYSWARKHADSTWYKRTGQKPPASVIEAAQRIGELRRPVRVRVVRSDCGRYWNVKGVQL